MEHDPANHHFNGSLILKTLLENPELLKAPEIKENKDKNVLCQYDASVAFLGPSWEKTIPFNNDEFKFEYMDLDEFLEENGIDDLHFKSPFPELNDAVSSPDGDTTSSPVALSPSSQPSLEEGCTFPVTKSTTLKVVKLDEELPDDHNPSSPESSRRSSSPVDYEISPQELALATVPGVEFDPRKRTFSENELKPQPLMKKSKKIYVPDDLKDDRYWCRRNKNNVAAKRSRDARRVKENQIVLRAQFLEKENNVLKRQVDKFRKENENLLARLAKYEG